MVILIDNQQMLTEKLIQDLAILRTYDKDTFTKVINYAINILTNASNTMKINEFIEIEEQQGEQLTEILLRMIEALVQYHTNLKDMENEVKLLGLSKDKREFLLEKISNNLEQLRKVVFGSELKAGVSGLNRLKWRVEVQVASKNKRSNFKPNILLGFEMNQQGKEHTHFINSDYANLKHLQQSLNNALRLHRSGKLRTARNSSV